MLLRSAGGGNHLCAQMAQQIAAFVEHADRVMVAAQNQQAHTGLVQPRNQLVVEFARIAGRCAGVEHIAGNQHGVDLMGLYLLQQPVNQCLMLGLAAAYALFWTVCVQRVNPFKPLVVEEVVERAINNYEKQTRGEMTPDVLRPLV